MEDKTDSSILPQTHVTTSVRGYPSTSRAGLTSSYLTKDDEWSIKEQSLQDQLADAKEECLYDLYHVHVYNSVKGSSRVKNHN